MTVLDDIQTKLASFRDEVEKLANEAKVAVENDVNVAVIDVHATILKLEALLTSWNNKTPTPPVA